MGGTVWVELGRVDIADQLRSDYNTQMIVRTLLPIAFRWVLVKAVMMWVMDRIVVAVRWLSLGGDAGHFSQTSLLPDSGK